MATVETKCALRKQLPALTIQEVTWYVGGSFQAAIYGYMNEEQQRDAVVDVAFDRIELRSGVIIMAHIEGNWIGIDEDTTDKPLLEALIVNAGVPREQIILAYAGKKVPRSTDA